jgi:hypothetical protein
MISCSFVRNNRRRRRRRRRFLAHRKSAREDADIKQAFLRNEETRAASRSGFAEIIAKLSDGYQVTEMTCGEAYESINAAITFRKRVIIP